MQLRKAIKNFIIFSIKKASCLKVPLVTEEQDFYVDNNLQHRCFFQDDGDSKGYQEIKQAFVRQIYFRENNFTTSFGEELSFVTAWLVATLSLTFK